jgi:hypothetical protein
MNYKTYEMMKDIRDLARTGTPPMSWGMTEEEWMRHKLNRVAGMANKWIEDNCFITDGFGAYWLRWCEDCGAEMHIMRPGDARCSNECYRDDEDENDNTDTD